MQPKSSNDLPSQPPRKDTEKETREAIIKDADKTDPRRRRTFDCEDCRSPVHEWNGEFRYVRWHKTWLKPWIADCRQTIWHVSYRRIWRASSATRQACALLTWQRDGSRNRRSGIGTHFKDVPFWR